jgi:hypothetical protein
MRDEEMTEMSFIKQRAKLKQYYKQLKAGMIVIEDVPPEYRPLLMKYYGYSG